MLRQRTTIAGIGLVAGVAVGAAVLTGTHSTGHAAAGSSGTSGTIRSQAVTVNGSRENILTNSRGMPLYYYAPDTATTSRVSGGLASLWPPVTSTATPTASGLTGKLAVVRDSHGSQVAYNGHLLYTFVSDRRGSVTGQGVQNFFVATPNLSAAGGSSPQGTTGGTTYGGY